MDTGRAGGGEVGARHTMDSDPPPVPESFGYLDEGGS